MAHNRSLNHFHPFPLAQLAAALALGILAGLALAVPLPILISVSALSTGLAAGALLAHRVGLATILVTVVALILGSTLVTIERTRVPANQLRRLLDEKGQKMVAVGEPLELTGVLARDPEVSPGRWYLEMRVESIRSREIETKVSGVVMMLVPVLSARVKDELAELNLCYGARVRVMTSLERSDRFRNPGVSTFTEYLDRKGFDATAFIKSPLLIERLENTPVFLPAAWLFEWRRRLQEQIDSHFSTETSGILDAMLLGNRYGLPRAAAERFREGGTFHVLVISGLHITFLGGLVFVVARRFTKNPRVQFLISVTILWAYSLAVGGESSVVRAALMFTFVLLAPLLSRRANSLSALGGAAITLLVWRPGDLFDPSFQLTFISVLAIVVLAWPLIQKMQAIGSWRPTRETPYPPSAAPWLRTVCEVLFWSEREWKRELKRASYSCRLFKAPLAGTLERFHLQAALRYIFAATVVSVCVQLTLLPLLVVYFHRLSLASVVLNIGVSLMMAAVIVAAALSLLLVQFSEALAAPFIGFTNAVNWLMVHSVDPFARLGIASVRLPEYTGWASSVYALYYAPLIALTVLLARWQPLRLQESDNRPSRFPGNALRFLGLDDRHAQIGIAKDAKAPPRYAKASRKIWGIALTAQLVAAAVIVFHPFSAAPADGKLRIDFLDVGQGDSALVTFPDNTTMLIDGGGAPRLSRELPDDEAGAFERDSRSIGEAVVSEYLWWRGLDHIDYLFASHADADHIDGLNDVVRNFAVRAILVARTPGRDAEYLKLANTAAAAKVPIYAIGAGDVLRIGSVEALVLWPIPVRNSDAPSANNDSVLLRIKFGDKSILFTGDVESPAEKALVEMHGSLVNFAGQQPSGLVNLTADVVKVAHHGSKTSSTAAFISATQARLAIIPVGQTSMFGHPHPEVVRRWRESGAQVLTTGQQGTITVLTDGRELHVETFVRP
ncbi:MAG TPA: ComEC/Rec2 family competence protein [Pyrinomonadaceae bacterium]|nr:ComEC/Rec2 family competence protein [Pyrinomonadaceae bacterium]